MPKLLRAVRLDDSDDQVFRGCGAARDGDWVVSRGYAVCDFENAPRCDPSWRNSSSMAEVAEVSEEELAVRIDALAWHLVKAWNAPSYDAARALAEEEVRHTAEVCETLSPEVWITVKRTRGPQGLEEEYAVYDRLLIGTHQA